MVRHPHTVAFYGCCIDPGSHSIITEYVGGGSLFEWLLPFRTDPDRRARELPPALVRVGMLRQAASAMQVSS